MFRAVQAEQVMDDEGESSHVPKRGQTLQIIRWIVVTVLVSSAVWILATYVLALAGFR
jgi:hypothetical protein